ncbi:putative reverse transcriptase domain-containing protein [Tanacetum coccineum]
MPNTRSGATMTREAIDDKVARRVAEALATRDAAMNLEPLAKSGDEHEDENDDDNESGNGNDGNGNGGNRNGGNGNEGNRNEGNDYENHNMNFRGQMIVARECTFQELKCKPLNFLGTERVVGLTRWFEKMETMFNIRNFDAIYAMKWSELMKLMTEVYCPMNEIQKMEIKLWNLTVKGNDLTTYTQRFQELIMLCTRMVLDEEDWVERFIGGLPDNIQGNVIAAEPTRL